MRFAIALRDVASTFFRLSAWFTGVFGGCYLGWYVHLHAGAFAYDAREFLASGWTSLNQTVGLLGMFAIFMVLSFVLEVSARVVEKVRIG